MTMILKPGRLGARRLARASISAPPPALDPACRAGVEAGAATVEAIVAKGEPVYGINTGFGKLAIGPHRAATTSSRCSATSCSRMPPASASRCPIAVVRLIMALKIASLAQGASGVRWATLDRLAPAALARRAAGHPGAGLGRRLRRSRAARASRRAPDRRRRGAARRRDACRRRRRFDAHGLAPLTLGAEGRAGASQRHAGLDRARARRPVRSRARVPGGAGHRRARDRCGEGLRRALRRAHPGAARPSPARARSPARCARCWPAAPSANRTASATTACRTPTACAASRR